MKVLTAINKCLTSVIIKLMSKYYDVSSKLIIGTMKNETRGVENEKNVGLKIKMYSFLVDNSEHKKGKSENKKIVTTISYYQYKFTMKLKMYYWPINL